MSEIKKIGMYTTDEILEHLTEGEGRGFLGRSMYDAIYFKIEKLETQLQQKENIIKEVREDLDKQITFCTNEANGTTNDKYCRIAINYLKHLKDKLDKGE